LGGFIEIFNKKSGMIFDTEVKTPLSFNTLSVLVVLIILGSFMSKTLYPDILPFCSLITYPNVKEICQLIYL